VNFLIYEENFLFFFISVGGHQFPELIHAPVPPNLATQRTNLATHQLNSDTNPPHAGWGKMCRQVQVQDNIFLERWHSVLMMLDSFPRIWLVVNRVYTLHFSEQTKHIRSQAKWPTAKWREEAIYIIVRLKNVTGLTLRVSITYYLKGPSSHESFMFGKVLVRAPMFVNKK
jgi:hypothetical protein